MSSATIIFFKTPCVSHLRAVSERRQTPRIRMPVPVKVRGVGGGRPRAELTSVIDNLSAGGFYTRLAQRFETGVRVFALIKFVVGSGEGKGVARLAVRGSVLRVDELPGGVYGVAVRIRRHRFL